MSNHPFPLGRPVTPLPRQISGRDTILRKRQAFGLLELICEQLELTATQFERAKSTYEAVSQWLSDHPLLRSSVIYLHGSGAHGTSVKPIGCNEHDVDLINHVPHFPVTSGPALLKNVIGDRLAENGRYAPILEEMPRCWRLNYAGDFHLDITPSIVNPGCGNGGELVPDKKLRIWKPTNPKGFRELFAWRASRVPRTPDTLVEGRLLGEAEVEPLPAAAPVKGVLRRAVQLLKRHRDIDFLNDDPDLIPLSIIITALASRAYEWCIENQVYDNELDLVCDTIRAMPWFIEPLVIEGRRGWLIPNETTVGENFAEKWNSDPRRAKRFFEWHARALADFEALSKLAGLDAVAQSLSAALGNEPVNKAMRTMTDAVSAARKTSRLTVAPAAGLGVGAATGTPVRANTFFGR